MKYKLLAALVFAGMTCSVEAELNIPEAVVAQVQQEYIDTNTPKEYATEICNMLGKLEDPGCIEVLHMEFYNAQVDGISYVMTNSVAGTIDSYGYALDIYSRDIDCGDLDDMQCTVYRSAVRSSFLLGMFNAPMSSN